MRFCSYFQMILLNQNFLQLKKKGAKSKTFEEKGNSGSVLESKFIFGDCVSSTLKKRTFGEQRLDRLTPNEERVIHKLSKNYYGCF